MLICVSCRGAWSAVTVSVAEPPGDTVTPPVRVSVGTLLLVIVVCAEFGDPTVEPPVAEVIDIVRVLSGFTTLSTRVGTDTVTEVAFAGRTTDGGGVTTSLLSTGPPSSRVSRLTVVSVLSAAVAVIKNEAATPSGTTASTDWIGSTGGAICGRNAVSSATGPLPLMAAEAVWP